MPLRAKARREGADNDGEPGDLPLSVLKCQSFRVKGDVIAARPFLSLFISRAHSVHLTKKAMRKLLYSLLVGLVAQQVSGQDSTRVTTLREVVVSAARTEQPVIETPRSVTVINAEVIRNSNHLSVGALLNEEGGLFITGAQQTPGTNQNVFMRGAGSNQVAVLIDGVRITDPTSPNAAVDLSEISLTGVERIEIIRGAHSTMFGGAAIGGVINIITRKDATEGVTGGVAWQGGAFDGGGLTSTEDISVRYGFGRGFYAAGSLFRQDVRGIDATVKNSTSPSGDRDDFTKTDATARLGYHNEKWDARLSYRKAYQKADIDAGAFQDDDNYYLTFDRDLFHYQVAYQLLPGLRLTVLGSYSDSERFYEDDSTQVDGVYDHTFATGTYYGNLQTHEVQVNLRHNLVSAVAGGGLYREDMNFDNYIAYNDPVFPFEQRSNYDTIGAKTNTGYAFVRGQFAGRNFNLSAGGRYTYHSTAGGFFTYELSPSYAVGDFLLYGSLSSAFNPPSLYQLFDPTPGTSAPRGNRDLKPERSRSLEVGVKKAFASGSYFTVSGYTTRVRDGIEYVYLWNEEKPVGELDYSDARGDRYINVAQQRMSGFEVEGMIRISEHVSFRASTSYVRTAVRARPDDIPEDQTGGHLAQLYNIGVFLDKAIEQEQLVRRPDFTAFSQLRYSPSDRWSFYLNYRYTGSLYDAGYDPALGPYGALRRLDVKGYHLFDLNASWEATSNLTAAARVENIMNEEYLEVVGFRARGRGVYLSLRYSL